MKQMKVLNKEEFVHILCCQSTGLAPSDMFSSILMTSSRTNVEFEGEAGEPSFRRLVLWSVAYIIRIRLFYSSSLITECTSTTVQFRFSSCRAREDTFKHYLLDRISSNCTSLTTSEFNECFSVTNVSDFSVICSLNFDNQLMFLFRALKEKTSLRFG